MDCDKLGGVQPIEEFCMGLATSDDHVTVTGQHSPLTSCVSNIFDLKNSRARRLSMRAFQMEDGNKVSNLHTSVMLATLTFVWIRPIGMENMAKRFVFGRWTKVIRLPKEKTTTKEPV